MTTCAFCGKFVDDTDVVRAAGRRVCGLVCARRFLEQTPASKLYQRASEV